MIYKPTNFVSNNRASDTTIVKYTKDGVNIVYSSVGKEIIDIVNNNTTTARNIINHITSTSGTYFSTAGKMRKDTHYGS